MRTDIVAQPKTGSRPPRQAAEGSKRVRQYSLAHLTVLGCPPPEMTYIAGRAGYDFVSLRIIPFGLPGEENYALAEKPDMLRQTKRALATTGVKVHDIELARILDDMHPTRYLPAMEVAAELGARAVLSSIWTTNIDYAIEKFAEVCDLAKPFGLTVDLEFVPVSGVKTLAGAAHVLRTIKRPNAGLMIDTLHFHRSRDKVEDLEGLPPEWFHFAHICDGPGDMPADPEEMTRIMREGRLYVGEGGVDIAGILNRLPDMVYSIELPNIARVREMGYAEHAFRCLETAKAYEAAKLRKVSEPMYH